MAEWVLQIWQHFESWLVIDMHIDWLGLGLGLLYFLQNQNNDNQSK